MRVLLIDKIEKLAVIGDGVDYSIYNRITIQNVSSIRVTEGKGIGKATDYVLLEEDGTELGTVSGVYQVWERDKL